jgi:hypothetical protein
VLYKGQEYLRTGDGLAASGVVYTVCEIYFSQAMTAGSRVSVNWIGLDNNLDPISGTVVKDVATDTLLVAVDIPTGSKFAAIQQVEVINSTPTAANYTINYLRLGICPTTQTLTPSVASSLDFNLVLPVVAKPPEWEAAVIPYSNTRSTAAAALFTNVTAVLNKEGTVGACRVPVNTPGVFSSDPYLAVAPGVAPKDRYWGPLERGFYAFSPPDQSTELFRDYRQTAEANVNLYPRFYLDGFDYIVVIQFTDMDATAGTNLAITIDNHLEFRTTSMLFPTTFSMTSLESYHLAQMALAKQGCMFENFVHLATIANLVRTAVTQLAPVVMPYIKPAAVSAGNFLLNKAVNAINDKLHQTQVKVAPAAQQPAKKKKKKNKKG